MRTSVQLSKSRNAAMTKEERNKKSETNECVEGWEGGYAGYRKGTTNHTGATAASADDSVERVDEERKKDRRCIVKFGQRWQNSRWLPSLAKVVGAMGSYGKHDETSKKL